MGESKTAKVLPSERVDFAPELPYALKSQLQVAVSEIDRVHRIVDKNIRLTVGQHGRRSEQGHYDPRNVRILISRHAEDPLGTFLHEFGHFLDNRILHPLHGAYASQYDLPMTQLMTACWRSKPVMEIEHLLASRRHRLTREERLFLEEAIEPYEIFARVYAQWVCSRSLNFLLRLSLNRRMETRHPFAGRHIRMQWEPDEFADIMVEISRLFREKGVL